MEREIFKIVVNRVGIGRTMAENPYYKSSDPELQEKWVKDNTRLAVQDYTEGCTTWCRGGKVKQGFYEAIKYHESQEDYGWENWEYDAFYVLRPYAWWDTNRITYDFVRKLVRLIGLDDDKLDIRLWRHGNENDRNIVDLLDIEITFENSEVYHINIYPEEHRIDIDLPESCINKSDIIEQELIKYITLEPGNEGKTMMPRGKKFNDG